MQPIEVDWVYRTARRGRILGARAGGAYPPLPLDYMRLPNRTGFLPKIKETIWFNGVEAKHGPPFLRKVLDPFLASEQTCASLCLAWDQQS